MKISYFFKRLTLIVIPVFVNSLRRANARFKQWQPFVTGWLNGVGRSQRDRQWVAMIGCFQAGSLAPGNQRSRKHTGVLMPSRRLNGH
jgi:undecaprenyl pyrophosphate phosphatase UppP